MNEKLKDWAGENVDMESCPECTKHPDCFANVKGYCTALRKPDGRASKKKAVDTECAFYKTEKKARESGIRAYRRLKENNRMDLIIQYADTLIHTGAMDDEIQEADLQAELLERFRETNFNEQMDKAKAEKEELAEDCSQAGA